jgi:hypothetical protein
MSARKSKSQRCLVVHKVNKQHQSKQTTYAIDENRRPKAYGDMLNDGFTAVDPDIW